MAKIGNIETDIPDVSGSNESDVISEMQRRANSEFRKLTDEEFKSRLIDELSGIHKELRRIADAKEYEAKRDE